MTTMPDSPPEAVRLRPEQMVIPPRFEDRPSPVLDLLRALNSGEKDWPTVRAALRQHDWADDTQIPEGMKPSDPDYATAVEDAKGPGRTLPPGSWTEFQTAEARGMVTPEQADQVLADYVARFKGKGNAPAPEQADTTLKGDSGDDGPTDDMTADSPAGG